MLVSCYILAVLLFLVESLEIQSSGQEVDSLQGLKSDKEIAKDYSNGESKEDAEEFEDDSKNTSVPELLKEAEIHGDQEESDEETEFGWIKNRNNLQEVKISNSQTRSNVKIVDKVIQSEDYQTASVSLVSPTGDYMEDLSDNDSKHTVQYRQPMPPVSMPAEEEVFTGMIEHDHATPDKEYNEKHYEPKQCVSTLKELYTCIFCASEATIKQHFVSCYHLLPTKVRVISIECANRIYDLSMTEDSYGVDYFDLFCKQFRKFKEVIECVAKEHPEPKGEAFIAFRYLVNFVEVSKRANTLPIIMIEQCLKPIYPRLTQFFKKEEKQLAAYSHCLYTLNSRNCC